MNENSTFSFFKNLNGTWQSDPGEFHNRGFLFADGLFETMVLRKGKIWSSEMHQERMLSGCQTLMMEISQLSEITEIEDFLADQNFQSAPLRVRWNVFRSGQGKYTPLQNGIVESLQVTSFTKSIQVKKTAAFSDNVTVPSSYWSHCKTLNALHYVMANLERSQRYLDEVILLNASGYVSEAGSSNIFWEKGGVFYTPSLKASCIAGVGRNLIIRELHKLGKKVEEGLFQKEDLLKAERVFTSNVTGVSLIEKIEGSTFDISGLPSEITSLFE